MNTWLMFCAFVWTLHGLLIYLEPHSAVSRWLQSLSHALIVLEALTVFPSALLNSLQVSPLCLTPLLNHTAALGILLLGLDALPAQTWLRHREPFPILFLSLRPTMTTSWNIPTFRPTPSGYLVLLSLHLTCGSPRVSLNLPMCPHIPGHSTSSYRQSSLFCGQWSPQLHFRGDVLVFVLLTTISRH